MAGSLNKVILVGRLGQDPKLAYTSSGSPVANFNIATNETYTDREGKKVEKTDWHRIVVFGPQAEPCSNYLGKGSQVLIEGRLQTRQWEDQQNQKRYTTEVVAQRVQFMDTKGQSGTGAYQESGQGQQASNRQEESDQDVGPVFPSEASAMDDVPF